MFRSRSAFSAMVLLSVSLISLCASAQEGGGIVTTREVVSMMKLLHPRATHARDATVIAREIAAAVTEDKQAPFAGSRELDAAVLVVTGWEESNFTMLAHNPHVDGKAWCAFQLHTDEGVKYDARRCTRLALARLHSSAKECPAHILAPYVGGCSQAAKKADRRLRRAEVLLVTLRAQRGLAEAQAN